MHVARELILLIGLAATSLHSAVAAPNLDGTWAGSGYVIPKSGDRQSIRCRVRYSRQSNTVFSVSATCAGSTANVVQTGEVLEVGVGRFAGDLYNPQFDVSGRVRVQVSGNRQTVTFFGAQGKGTLSLVRQ